MKFGLRSSPPKWSAGLCNCCQDPKTCFITCCLPCVTFGQIAEVVDEGRSSCVGHGIAYGLLMCVQLQWIYSCLYRDKLRAKFGLPAEPCCDCCVHWCCDTCALCQEHAELKSRGLDPSHGWPSPNAAPRFPQAMFR